MARYEADLELDLEWPSSQYAQLVRAESADGTSISRVRVRRIGERRALLAAVVRASSPAEASAEVSALLLRCGLEPDAVTFSLVRRRHSRRARERLVLGVRSGDDGPDDTGLAGVREPRRPLPAPPALRAEVPEPAPQHRI